MLQGIPKCARKSKNVARNTKMLRGSQKMLQGRQKCCEENRNVVRLTKNVARKTKNVGQKTELDELRMIGLGSRDILGELLKLTIKISKARVLDKFPGNINNVVFSV